MDAVFVDEHTLHLEICLLTIFLILILDKCILETVAGALVTYDLARDDGAETTKYQIQVFICIELY